MWSRNGEPTRVLQLSWVEMNFATSLSELTVVNLRWKDFSPEGINNSQTVVTGREGYHQTSNTEDTNNVFELSTESARSVFKMSVIETCSK